MSSKPPVKRVYINGVLSDGESIITVGDLRRLLERCTDMSDSTPVICSSDAEGNRYGGASSIIFENPNLVPDEDDFELPGMVMKALSEKHGVLVITPQL